MERRVFLGRITALAAAGVPLLARARKAAGPAYDPQARFELEVRDVPFRRNAAGRELQARVYQPVATARNAGPFPVLLDLHGGAWVRKDRTANEPMDRAVAASGVLVVAIDMTLAGEAPYPAAVQDASYGVRWLKSRAREWKGDPSRLGLLGSSSGGHVAELIAMRPNDDRYTKLALPASMKSDTSIAYVVTRSPISDPYARWQQAQKLERKPLIEASRTFFRPWQAIHEANPQEMLDRREAVELRPLLVMQGALDDNVLPAVQEKFAASYNAAGGECRLELFAGCEHEWIAKPGPQTERAHEMVKAFIARQLARA
jgi:acetyl esterase/lipase